MSRCCGGAVMRFSIVRVPDLWFPRRAHAPNSSLSLLRFNIAELITFWYPEAAFPLPRILSSRSYRLRYPERPGVRLRAFPYTSGALAAVKGLSRLSRLVPETALRRLFDALGCLKRVRAEQPNQSPDKHSPATATLQTTQSMGKRTFPLHCVSDR